MVIGHLNSLALLTQKAALHNTRQNCLAAMAAQGLEPAEQSVYFCTCADRQLAVNIHSRFYFFIFCHISHLNGIYDKEKTVLTPNFAILTIFKGLL